MAELIPTNKCGSCMQLAFMVIQWNCDFEMANCIACMLACLINSGGILCCSLGYIQYVSSPLIKCWECRAWFCVRVDLKLP